MVVGDRDGEEPMTIADQAMRDRWIAPWTDEQANILNEIQKDTHFHGYTCPGEMATCSAPSSAP